MTSHKVDTSLLLDTVWFIEHLARRSESSTYTQRYLEFVPFPLSLNKTNLDINSCLLGPHLQALVVYKDHKEPQSHWA